MRERTPSRPAIPGFTPVPRKYRHDGWTPERQRAFIDALADTGSVSNAAHMVNMSPEGAYYLRRQPGAESFRAAWEAALDHGVTRLRDALMERAIDGVPVPIMHGGAQVAEKRVYNDRLGMFILRHHDPNKYGDPAARRNGASPSTRAALKREYYEEEADRADRYEGDIRARILEKVERLEESIGWFRERGMHAQADEARGMVLMIDLRIMAMADYARDRQARKAARAAVGEVQDEKDDDPTEIRERYAPQDDDRGGGGAARAGDRDPPAEGEETP